MRRVLASIAGSLAAGAGVLCPACTPGVAALLVSLGLPALASVVTLRRVLAAFLALAVLGLVFGYRRHRRLWPLLGGLAGAGALYAARWVAPSPPLLYGGAALLIGASVADGVLQRRARPCCDAAERRDTRRRSTETAFGAAFLLSVGLATQAGAGPITFDTALAISKGEGILRGQTEVVRATDDPSPMDRHLTVVAAPAVLGYGATGRLALFGVVPFLHKNVDVTTPAGRVSRGDTGLGDALFFGRYTLLQVDRPGSTLRLAPLAGLKAPTGSHDEADRFGRLPRSLQLGSGSWDPLLGTVFTWQTLGWELDADAAYRFNTTADRFSFGDEARTDASFQYRIWPRRLGPGVAGFLYVVLESNVIWQDKDRFRGQADRNSGGVTWFVDPGLQYVTRRWVLEAVVQLPAVQNLNGAALGTDYRAVAGFRWNFSFPFHS